MSIANVTLDEMLLARDKRVQRQTELINATSKPVLSFTMNIAGPVKNSPLIRFAFRCGLSALQTALGEPMHFEMTDCHTGCEALLQYDIDAANIKDATTLIEETHPVGRLFDMDVIGTDYEKLSRPSSRKCIVCGGPVSICSRSRAHGLAAICGRTNDMLSSFAAQFLANAAKNALVEEVLFTPKPGLVDGANNGAHKDMDCPLFIKSAQTLEPFFEQFVRLGMDNASPTQLQQLGINSERAMFAETNGINTHKGALYAMGLLLSAAGTLLSGAEGDIYAIAANYAAALLPPDSSTHGQQVLKKHGTGGAREQALAGFPAARSALNALKKHGALTALLTTIATLDDSNLLYRGGKEGLAFAKSKACEILALPLDMRAAAVEKFDREMIKLNLSPGGSADILAIAMFLNKIDELV